MNEELLNKIQILNLSDDAHEKIKVISGLLNGKQSEQFVVALSEQKPEKRTEFINNVVNVAKIGDYFKENIFAKPEFIAIDNIFNGPVKLDKVAYYLEEAMLVEASFIEDLEKIKGLLKAKILLPDKIFRSKKKEREEIIKKIDSYITFSREALSNKQPLKISEAAINHADLFAKLDYIQKNYFSLKKSVRQGMSSKAQPILDKEPKKPLNDIVASPIQRLMRYYMPLEEADKSLKNAKIPALTSLIGIVKDLPNNLDKPKVTQKIQVTADSSIPTTPNPERKIAPPLPTTPKPARKVSPPPLPTAPKPTRKLGAEQLSTTSKPENKTITAIKPVKPEPKIVVKSIAERIADVKTLAQQAQEKYKEMKKSRDENNPILQQAKKDFQFTLAAAEIMKKEYAVNVKKENNSNNPNNSTNNESGPNKPKIKP